FYKGYYSLTSVFVIMQMVNESGSISSSISESNNFLICHKRDPPLKIKTVGGRHKRVREFVAVCLYYTRKETVEKEFTSGTVTRFWPQNGCMA
ncbi:MAG: hypothetical protein ABIC40_00445, partial [bacterium]